MIIYCIKIKECIICLPTNEQLGAASWNRSMSCFINIAKLLSKGFHHLQFYEWCINVPIYTLINDRYYFFFKNMLPVWWTKNHITWLSLFWRNRGIKTSLEVWMSTLERVYHIATYGIYTHTHICIYIQIHIYIYVCVHVCIYLYTHTHTHIQDFFQCYFSCNFFTISFITQNFTFLYSHICLIFTWELLYFYMF